MDTSPSLAVDKPITPTNWHVVGVALMFASNGALLGVLAPWYPSFVQKWLFDEATFGLIVACMPLGALLSATLPAVIAKRFGPLRAVGFGTALMSLALVSVGWLPHGLLLGAVLLTFGICDATVDVSQNLCGVRVEQRRTKSIMSSLHACWSLGAASAGAVATTVALSGTDYRAFIVVGAPICVGLAITGCWLVGPAAKATELSAAEADSSEARVSGKMFTRPVLFAMLPLAAIAISAVVVEDVATNWASIAAAQLTGVEVSAAGMTFALIVGAQTVGRFTGDPLINRFGRDKVARVGGLLIALGSVLVVSSTTAPILMAGFMLSGFGCGTLVPSVFAVAARLPVVSDSGGLTLVSWLMRVGFLMCSPIVGAIATGVNLRAALGIVIVSGVTVMLLAPALRVDAGSKTIGDSQTHEAN